MRTTLAFFVSLMACGSEAPTPTPPTSAGATTSATPSPTPTAASAESATTPQSGPGSCTSRSGQDVTRFDYVDGRLRRSEWRTSPDAAPMHVTEYRWDGPRLSAVERRSPSAVLFTQRFTYDDAGRLVEVVKESMGASTRERWEYGPDGRLATRTTGDEVERFFYEGDALARVEAPYGTTTFRWGPHGPTAMESGLAFELVYEDGKLARIDRRMGSELLGSQPIRLDALGRRTEGDEGTSTYEGFVPVSCGALGGERPTGVPAQLDDDWWLGLST